MPLDYGGIGLDVDPVDIDHGGGIIIGTCCCLPIDPTCCLPSGLPVRLKGTITAKSSCPQLTVGTVFYLYAYNLGVWTMENAVPIATSAGETIFLKMYCLASDIRCQDPNCLFDDPAGEPLMCMDEDCSAGTSYYVHCNTAASTCDPPSLIFRLICMEGNCGGGDGSTNWWEVTITAPP